MATRVTGGREGDNGRVPPTPRRHLRLPAIAADYPEGSAGRGSHHRAVGAWDLGEHWRFELRGDIGGFGVSSEFTSQMSLVALYDISETISIPLGYRILNYRIKTDDVWMDTSMGGLVVGVDIRP